MPRYLEGLCVPVCNGHRRLYINRRCLPRCHHPFITEKRKTTMATKDNKRKYADVGEDEVEEESTTPPNKQMMRG
jgi:hypothetical protein